MPVNPLLLGRLPSRETGTIEWQLSDGLTFDYIITISFVSPFFLRSSSTSQMRPTLSRCWTLISRDAVPKKHLETVGIRPSLLTAKEQQRAPTLIDHLNARKAQRDVELAEAANLEGDAPTNALRWPSNLRIEPVISRSTFSQVAREHRKSLKQSLKER